jgi:TetR/AcrR family transcriptional regulator, mexJK operon transcriptional repressor
MTIPEHDGRERVLREAHALFLDRGFAEVSMQQIADAAGMTKASLYYHFRDKEDLFAHVVHREGERLLGGLTEVFDQEGSFHDQLMRITLYLFSAIRSDIGRLMSDAQRHVSEKSHKRMHEALESGPGRLDPIAALRPAFERAQACGEMRQLDLSAAAILYFSMVGGCFKFATELSPEVRLGETEAANIVDIFLNGVAAQPHR